MKNIKTAGVMVCLVLCGASLSVGGTNMKLLCNQPAAGWMDALPIGNGRLGAMVFGGITNERIQLNEGTLWGGAPYDPSNPDALAALPDARRLVFEGKYKEAVELISQKMMARPLCQVPYQPLGDLALAFTNRGAVTGYRCELDLDTAIVTVSYVVDGVKFTREAFSSPVDQVIVVRVSADKRGQVGFRAALPTPQRAMVTADGIDTLVLNGRNGDALGMAGALKFQARLRVMAEGGTTAVEQEALVVTGADSATLLLSAATSYRNYRDVSGDPEAPAKASLAGAAAKTFAKLREDHVAEHRRLFRRVMLDLGPSGTEDLTTRERITKFTKGDDPGLAALFYQYGRYLLMSCSRPGGQPATLQGLWNQDMRPAWESKYTININTEMNYWLAEAGNLGECTEPLIRMVTELVEPGGRVARTNWGAGGWVCHHNTDLWRATGPIDAPWWGFWPCGGAWLCQHLWERYEFDGDKDYLAKIYPVLKGSAQFFMDTLVEEPKHRWLVTCPSLSPENTHPGGTSICAGPTIDLELLRDLFNECIRASEILDTDREFRAKAAATRDRLAPLQIGAAGQLQEWLDDWDMKAPNIHFGHVSHLYGLYPSSQITRQGTPELWAAAKKSLEIRGDFGGGWPCAWQINLWARLYDGERAYQALVRLLRPNSPQPNMFISVSPFQIDSSLGGAAGVVEMLLQSHSGEIALLPALPKAWPNGKVTGLRARGGFTVDIEWKDGKVVAYRIASKDPRSAKVRVNGEVKTITSERL